MTRPQSDPDRILVGRLRAAMDAPGATMVDDEHLAMLIEGRVDELSASDRARMLDAAAGDPEIASLVRELMPLMYEGPAYASGEAGNEGLYLRVFVRAGWAVAAVWTLCLGVLRARWAAVSPPGNTDAAAMHATASEPAGAGRSAFFEIASSDVVWWGTIAAMCVLTAWLAVQAMQKRKRRARGRARQRGA